MSHRRPPARVKGAVPLAPTSFFYQDISRAPLAPNSAYAAANLANQVTSRYNGVAAFNVSAYNVGYHVVKPGTRRITVQFFNCQNKTFIDRGLFDGPKYFVDVPVPDDAVPAKGTDQQMTIYDPSTDQLWEFWKAQRNPATGAWEACWGGRIDHVSKSNGVFPGRFGASATSLSMSAGMISLDDVRRGSINHAIYLAVVDAQMFWNYSWPANRSDGYKNDPNIVMEGQRVRLNPKLDLRRYKLTPLARMIAVAAQKYGFIVSDKAGAVAVISEAGDVIEKRTGKNPWNAILTTPSYEVMRNFPWNQVQVVRKDWGKPA